MHQRGVCAVLRRGADEECLLWPSSTLCRVCAHSESSVCSSLSCAPLCVFCASWGQDFVSLHTQLEYRNCFHRSGAVACADVLWMVSSLHLHLCCLHPSCSAVSQRMFRKRQTAVVCMCVAYVDYSAEHLVIPAVVAAVCW